MSVNGREIVQVCLVGYTAVTHKNFVVNDGCQRQPAEYVAVQSY